MKQPLAPVAPRNTGIPRSLGAAFRLLAMVVLAVALAGASSVPAARACSACQLQLTFGSEGTGDGQFERPGGIAIGPSGNVYVADFGNNRIEEFTATGQYVAQWGTLGAGPGQFNNPADVAVDSAGNVYVTDAGNILGLYGPVSAGNLSDTSNNRVEKFTSDGQFVLQWGSRGPNVGQFVNPAGIAVGPNGYVYVTDWGNERVEAFTSTGIFVSSWGSLGTDRGEFNNIGSIAVDSSGTVYVADSGNGRVQAFTGDGAYLAQIVFEETAPGSNATTTWAPGAIATDASNSVYVTNGQDANVYKFSSAGAYLGNFSSYEQSGESGGIAVASSGNIYVVNGSPPSVNVLGDAAIPTPEFSGAWQTITLTVLVCVAALHALRRERRGRGG